METSMSKMKCCNKCNEEKPLSEFSNNKSKKDGKFVQCKECKKIIDKQHRLDNPDYFHKYYKNNKQLHLKRQHQWRTNKSAVYEIFSDNLCLYVGQSKGINGRWNNHKSCLKRQSYADKHHKGTAYLYPLLRSHSNVDFRIVEEASPEALLRLEQHYIDELKPLYNTYNT